MMIILLGRNRAEPNTIKVKDFDKHFFQARKQGYRIFPDGLLRMRIFKDGIEYESEETIVYPENGIIPHKTCGLDYSPLAIKTDIDFHKDATSRNFFNRFKLFADNAHNVYKALAPYLGLIVAGLVVLYAFMFGS